MMFDIDPMILPKPHQSFEWRTTPAGPGLSCPALDEFADHLFTTRHWALGSRPVDEGFAWQQAAAALGLDPDALVRPRQVHGRASVVASRNRHPPEADIIVNDACEMGIAVQVADCVPLLFADRTTGAVAAVHAGWRGLSARVPEAAVAVLSQQYGSRPADLIVACGPSIGACCYEVGSDVREAFASGGFSAGQLDRWFLEKPASSARNPSIPRATGPLRANHWFFDGWMSSREQLVAAGVPPDRIFVAELCTASHPDVLCSYRRDGAPAGRMAAVIRPRLQHP
jgi:YfiH family protein